jgi:glycosyltransferase involved in cell wall biosynthesis
MKYFNGETTYLVKPRDTEGLANAIIHLIEHRDLAIEARRSMKKTYCLLHPRRHAAKNEILL